MGALAETTDQSISIERMSNNKLKRAEYIEYEDETKEEPKKVPRSIKVSNTLHKSSEFVLACFGIYIAMTIEFNWVKAVMLSVFGLYFITFIHLTIFMTKQRLKLINK